jgi:hypothetical protein
MLIFPPVAAQDLSARWETLLEAATAAGAELTLPVDPTKTLAARVVEHEMVAYVGSRRDEWNYEEALLAAANSIVPVPEPPTSAMSDALGDGSGSGLPIARRRTAIVTGTLAATVAIIGTVAAAVLLTRGSPAPPDIAAPTTARLGDSASGVATPTRPAAVHAATTSISAEEMTRVLQRYVDAYSNESVAQLRKLFASNLVRVNGTDPAQGLDQALQTYRSQFAGLTNPSYSLGNVQYDTGRAVATGTYTITSAAGTVSGRIAYHFIDDRGRLLINELAIVPTPASATAPVAASEMSEVLQRYVDAYSNQSVAQLRKLFASNLVRVNGTDPAEGLDEALQTYRSQFASLTNPSYSLTNVQYDTGQAVATGTYSITSAAGTVSGRIAYHFIRDGQGALIDRLSITPS